MAIANSPDGLWEKLDKPILEPAPTIELFGEKDSYNSGLFQGRVHDPMLFYYRNKFYLYYKVYSSNINGNVVMKYAGRDTRWCVAISDKVEGPLAEIRWGLCHVDLRGSKWNYIFRFDTIPFSPDGFPTNYPPMR